MFETIDVQNTDEHLGSLCGITILSRQTLVHDRHKPLKHARINEFRDRVADNDCLGHI